MTLSTIFLKTFKLSALATALTLAGCGGGGGNDTVQPPADSGSSTGGTDNTGGTASEVNISAINLTDANSTNTTTINSAGAIASVKVTDAAGNAISGAIVTFSASGGVTFGTTNGAVLTNAEGIAAISIKPTDATDTGAYTISASTTYNNITATTTNAYAFSLQPSNIFLADLTAASTSLKSGGSTNITLVTKDATTNTVQNNITVNFSTSCGTFTNSTVNSVNQGNVTTTYKAIDSNGKLCEGIQTITASTASGTTQSKSIDIAIDAIQASSVVYTTTDAINLATRNSGSSSSGQVQFTVYANGVPAANQSVVISKTYAPSDFSFISLGNQSTQTVRSDSNGIVTVMLYPGNIPGPVELKAALITDSSIVALSKNVAVVNSRATQNGITLGIGKNVLLNNTDDSTTITMRFTNRNGTNVPTGTVVNFISEGGKVDPSCATDDTGSCTVTFTSQQPRPVDGRASVLAYLEGDKQYIDHNGDNNYTAGIDSLVKNIGDFFRDDNENNVYNSDIGEFIYRRNNGSLSCNNAGTFFEPNLEGTCNTELAATLRRQIVFGFADETPTFDGLSEAILNAGGTFYMYGNGSRTVSMPSGTTITVTSEDKSENNMTCEAELTHGISTDTIFTVPAIVSLMKVSNNPNQNTFIQSPETQYGLNLTKCDLKSDKVTITVTAPNGHVTKISNRTTA